MSKSTSYHNELEEMNDLEWELSRKTFIRSMLMAGVAVQLPFVSSCESKDNKEEGWGNTSPLSENQFKTIRIIQEHLFPKTEDGPGALEVKADSYLCWVLNDPLLNPKEAEYIIKYLDKFRNTCKDHYNKEYYDLAEKDQTILLKAITTESWGKRWASRLITLIFEALLLDPIYGANPAGIGWEWLNHDPGFPRPVNENSYPELLQE